MKGTVFVVCAALSLAATAQGKSILLESTFREDAEPGWVSEGAAELTGGNQDPLGDGWLRLTPAVGNTTGFMYNTSPVPFDAGIQVEIEFKIWGWTSSSPADGFVFAFFDGDTPVPTAGGFGGSLGYAQSNGNPGLTGAILGVGVDEFGNFSNPTEDRVGGPGFTPNAITIRGPGEGAGATAPNGSPNYGFVTTSGGGIQLTSGGQGDTVRPEGIDEYRRMNLTVDTREFAHGKLPISLSLTSSLGGSPTELLFYDAYNELVNFYGGVANIPTTVKFGFTAGTGGQNAYHEVRGLRVLSINNVPDYVGEVPEPGNWVLMLTGVALLAVYGLRKRPSRRRGETSST